MYILTGDFSSVLLKKQDLMMAKKIIIIILIICSVFALNFDAGAVDSKAWKIYQENKLRKKRIKKAEKTAWSTWKVFRTILLYVPNRIVDATDIFTFDFSIGDFFECQMQATRYAQYGGATGESFFITKAYRRQYGTGFKDTHRFGFGFMEKEVTIVDETTGNVKEYIINFPHFLVANRRLDAFYYDDVDFWKVGINMGWFIGFGFGFDSVEFADFFTGIVMIDISKDDF